jgi:hypothetical protein
MTMCRSNDNANNPWIKTMGNTPTLSRSRFLLWWVPMLCIATCLAGCATRHPVTTDNPVTAKDHFQLGARFFSSGQLDNALSELSKAIMLDPNYTGAYQLRAIIYSKTDLNAAVSDYTSAIRIQPNEPFDYTNRAIAYNMLGDGAHALADLDIAISLSQSRLPSAPLHRMKADILFIDGRFVEALTEYRLALENMPEPSSFQKMEFAVHRLGLDIDPLGRVETPMRQYEELDIHRTYINERVHLCEAVVHHPVSDKTPQAISIGMSKEAVFQSVLVSERIVGHNRLAILPRWYSKNQCMMEYPQPECWVTVSKAGSFEDKTIGVLVFKDNKLTAEKRVPLKDVSVLSEGSRTQTLTVGPGQQRAQVLEALRTTDNFIYEDDQFIVTFAEDLPAKDKRIRLTMLKDGKVLYSGYGSRPLW